nr:uncharacterized protein CTRU02_04565 [Colletotrichum truncatum]KAF6795755.1 hypothetical protein CTRU02_04565 [Colletotrichum truncatum]
MTPLAPLPFSGPIRPVKALTARTFGMPLPSRMSILNGQLPTPPPGTRGVLQTEQTGQTGRIFQLASFGATHRSRTVPSGRLESSSGFAVGRRHALDCLDET